MNIIRDCQTLAKRMTWALGALTLLLAISQPAPVLADELDFEYKLKTAYLFNFAKFTTWRHLNNQPKKIDLCVTDLDKYEGMKEQLSGRALGQMSLNIKSVRPNESIEECEILFVDEANEAEWLERVEGLASVLTVGESRSFLKEGGIIQFYIENGKLRFAVNIDSLRKSSVNIEGRMLRLAKRVGGGEL